MVNVYPQTLTFRHTAQQRVDLYPLDCYLYGHLENLMQSAPNENEEKLFGTRHTIRNRAGTFDRVRHSMIRRVHECTDSAGGRL